MEGHCVGEEREVVGETCLMEVTVQPRCTAALQMREPVEGQGVSLGGGAAMCDVV